MLSIIILIFILMLFLVLAVREKARLRLYREKDWSMIGDSKPSPLSEALVNIIGVAGGIYLSLVVLTTFIELQLPHRVEVAGVSLEPLATLSIILALVQPFIYRVVAAWRKI